MAEDEHEQEGRVKALCDALNAHDVKYVVFGSFAPAASKVVQPAHDRR